MADPEDMITLIQMILIQGFLKRRNCAVTVHFLFGLHETVIIAEQCVSGFQVQN